MRQWIAAATLALAAAHAAATDGHHRCEYYSTLAFRESPYADIRGVVELTAEEAWPRNHYRFAYDEDGRLVELSFRLRDTLRPLNDTTNYLVRAPRIAIDYEDGVETRTFFDEHDAPITTAGGVYKEVYTLDSLGQRTSLTFLDHRGEPVESSWGIAAYHWTTSPDGSVIETRIDLDAEPAWMRPNLHFGTLRLEYDARGLLAVMRNIDERGALVENETGAAQDKLRYDRLGRLESWNVLDAAGNLECGNSPDVARGIPTYDEHGYQVAIRYEDEAGEPIRNRYGFGGSRAEFDKFGNRIRRETLNEHGQPLVVEGRGYHGYTFEYDRSGLHLQRMALYGLDGEPATHAQRGYAAQEFAYDDRGNLIRITHVDTNGDPVDRLDNGVSIIEHTYDGFRRVETRRLDKHGEPVRERWAVTRYSHRADGLLVGASRFDAAGAAIDP